jgi:hypothetical protein
MSGVSSIFMWLFEVRFRRKIKGYIRIYGNDLGRFKDEHPDEYSSLEEMLDVQL